jgi:hypothetical protein
MTEAASLAQRDLVDAGDGSRDDLVPASACRERWRAMVFCLFAGRSRRSNDSGKSSCLMACREKRSGQSGQNDAYGWSVSGIQTKRFELLRFSEKIMLKR